jgi:hypothetical protein
VDLGNGRYSRFASLVGFLCSIYFRCSEKDVARKLVSWLVKAISVLAREAKFWFMVEVTKSELSVKVVKRSLVRIFSVVDKCANVYEEFLAEATGLSSCARRWRRQPLQRHREGKRVIVLF